MLADAASLIFILTGALLIFAAAVGVARFRDTMSRVHAISKPQTIGLVLCLIGACIRVVFHPDFDVNHRSDLGIVVLLGLFALMTAPVTAQRISRIARREGLYAPDMSRNDRPRARRR
ncbi:monovalent cation/H(+) antiporter subunit G [Corynebacterium lizhenjunii]|uniref:Monovalent cation/H(+) antiporter subunit G n=1 Tax=Corynebacterium lizhenjunii TaxID=2709394 RepID=A0A7T0KF56_9CORY|nr:monovalent cation/H(+) antiporter subunit G [Corynebacterium lizhenjunii]QPK78924.1 monovalent cation/H(+) antiporter subunit G [Corynebacterium lizhenjunii]